MLNKFDTSNVTDMDSMFFECAELTKLNIARFTTGKNTNLHALFRGCSKLTELLCSDARIRDVYTETFPNSTR